MAAAKPHVLIIGAGLGGLFLAQILRKKGVSFEIFESGSAERDEASLWPKAITLHSVVQSFEALLPSDMPPARETLDLCKRLGLEPQFCVHVADNPRMGVVHSQRSPMLHASHFELLQWLSTNVTIAGNKKASKIDETTDAVVVTFEDGTSATGDLLVGADGVNSFVRDQILGSAKANWLEGVAVHGSVVLSGDDLKRQLELAHAGSIMPTKPDPSFDVLYIVLEEVLDNGQSARFSWQCGSYEEGPSLNGYNMAPEDLRQKALESTKMVDPRGRKVIEQTPADGLDGCYYYKDAKVEEIPAGRITLLGDAAHTCAPFKGDGAVQALRDAIRLGNGIASLESYDKDAIKCMIDEYLSEMIPRGVAAVRAGKGGLSEYTNLLSKPRVFGGRLNLVPEEKLMLDPSGRIKMA